MCEPPLFFIRFPLNANIKILQRYFLHPWSPEYCTRPAGPLLNFDPASIELLESDVYLIRSGSMDVLELIKQQVTSHPVVLYMKGSPQFPQCGFSANAVRILSALGVKDYFSVDVLQEPEIRQNIKNYANWPTIPQLYINGEFVGGSDIMTEMYQSGELQKLLKA